ncbi:hypothetical protein H5410_023004 [Solanum commersonii]|uniref:Uncharacterized protein n=1 Tax=Solanum commersonii TaxID=4109 RepID=A0A9J5ZFM4_SOLCO|nr:hypothetical protein H5410_023004 [Solanum commersonii]
MQMIKGVNSHGSVHLSSCKATRAITKLPISAPPDLAKNLFAVHRLSHSTANSLSPTSTTTINLSLCGRINGLKVVSMPRSLKDDDKSMERKRKGRAWRWLQMKVEWVKKMETF